MNFDIPAMSCGHCVGVITETVKQLDPHASVSADLAAKTVSIQTAEERQVIAQALTEAGYPTH
ncbi:MAG: heavy-metal-associated domain-containing protein [Polaromonas sp.]